MRTPPLRRRVVAGGSIVIALVLLAFDAFVYFSVRQELENSLADVLAVRAEAAAGLAGGLDAAALADGLAELGVPAVVAGADGQQFVSAPATPRVGDTTPATAVPQPRVSRTIALPDGGVAAVFATRAGVDATLRHLLAVISGGTVVAIVVAYAFLRRATLRALRPLDEVVATAEQITAGARGQRLEPEQTTTELGRMATAFDDMLDTLEQAVARATDEQERSRRFLADAAHQLRTPITGIRATAELMLHQDGSGVRDRLVANTLRETGRAGRLISELLHIARLDRAEPPERAATDLVVLCEDELERACGFAPDLELELVRGAGASRPVEVDADEIRNAVANLLDNARRHARHRVRLSVDVDGACATIRVADDGPGIPAGLEDRAFERFATLDGKGGSGLGLPIARAVARNHGGDLTYGVDGFVLRVATAP